MREYRPRVNVEARFWSKVDKTGECWEWTGARLAGKGYGRFKIAGRTIGAHRQSLEWALGRPLGPAEQACHRCDNPPCVRPAHLFVGTAAANNADRDAKGRQSNGLHTMERREKARASMKRRFADGYTVHNSGKALCKRGHPLDGPNLRVTPNGYRHCRTCDAARKRHSGTTTGGGVLVATIE